jgi:hypothetical protein
MAGARAGLVLTARPAANCKIPVSVSVAEGGGAAPACRQQTVPAHLLFSRASKQLRARTLAPRASLASGHHRLRSRTLRRPPRAARQVCNARDQCYTCWPRTGCAPLKEYNRLVVREHGRLHGAAAMKAEVRAPDQTRSPIFFFTTSSSRAIGRGAAHAHVAVGEPVTGGG